MPYFLLHPKNADVVEGRAAWRSIERLGFIAFLVIGLLSILVIGGIVGFVELKRAIEHRRLANDGIIHEANITKVYKVSGYQGSSLLMIDYQFVGENKHSYQDSKAVSQPFYRTARVGQVIQIRYLPTDPTVSELVNETNTTLIDQPKWLAFVMLIFGGSLLLMGGKIRSNLYQYYSLKNGKLLEATLVSIEKVQRLLIIVGEYYSPQTQQPIRMVGYGRVPPENTPCPTIGTRLYILYHSDQLYEVL